MLSFVNRLCSRVVGCGYRVSVRLCVGVWLLDSCLITICCSLSINGEKFEIAKAVAKNVINTLTKQDYVNVVCSRASHWNDVGKYVSRRLC